MSLYAESIPRFTHALTSIERWLDEAVANAKSRSFDPEVLLSARLSPDQFPLIKQIQAACDQAKAAPARMTEKEPPKHPDTEKTLEELRARIATVKAYLATFEAKEFDGIEKRELRLPMWQGKAMYVEDYLHQFALPNFYFHLAMAYAILRHSGVPLGKVTFIGPIDLH